MLSCLTSINSVFDQWHVRKQGLKRPILELSKKTKRIVEERIVERSTCFGEDSDKSNDDLKLFENV